MTRWWRHILPLVALLTLCVAPAYAQPAGTMTFAVHVTLATRWLDPAETDAEITPFMIFYVLHDALVKPMPPASTRPASPIVDHVQGWARLGVRPPEGRPLPQRRSRHG